MYQNMQFDVPEHAQNQNMQPLYRNIQQRKQQHLFLTRTLTHYSITWILQFFKNKCIRKQILTLINDTEVKTNGKLEQFGNISI